MENLFKETLEFLNDHGKSPEDVQWCGSEEYGWFTWDEFALLAYKNYDSGFGGREVAQDLLIVGEDWWLERHEYDGSEWWEYKTQPKKPIFLRKQPVGLFVDEHFNSTLSTINK